MTSISNLLDLGKNLKTFAKFICQIELFLEFIIENFSAYRSG